MRKQLKTNTELESMIMDRVRKNADWWHVKGAIVTPLQRSAPYLPNWDATFVVDGAALRPSEIHYLVAALQNQYDLSGAQAVRFFRWRARALRARPGNEFVTDADTATVDEAIQKAKHLLDTALVYQSATEKDGIVPTEMPDLEDIRRKGQTGWVPTRTQTALMLVAVFSGYVHWPILYLLLLALAWISLEADRRVALGVSLRWDPSYWIWMILTTVFFLLGPFEAGHLISLIDEYFHS